MVVSRMRDQLFHQLRSSRAACRLSEDSAKRDLDGAAQHFAHGAGEQDHQCLDGDDHLARDAGHDEGQLLSALIEHAEQQARRARSRPGAPCPSRPRRCRRSRPRRHNRASAGPARRSPIVDRHHAGERARKAITIMISFAFDMPA